ncbi:MAG: UDP-4-amino-4,6-dideoxy-N-acetyl-beta-L-altrosamine transaminase [Bacteroidetes bacterium]|nr:UDP-4-amino-4,6-dideoxy-N-acetyl-beta-L-altrosamine transaminase [Bacteroidota bacterium]MBS1631946.1 UDP-4-amino-4,6-dideoxy-N-acetyl-beta-L-altrosamine transaminase [Bacteroidota bacterium]
MSKPIPYGKQSITEEDIAAVVETLQSDFLTQGPKIEEFETAFANYIGSKYAVAVANGTAALHLASMAFNVSPGQKVITTPITFSASANCVRYCGAEVLFADIDPKTYTLDLNRVEDLFRKEKNISGVVPVDFAGQAVDLEELKKITDKYGAWILEDACHAPGGYFTDSKGTQQKCGNGAFASQAIFSFHPVKHIACGEGGMITTNDEKIYKRLSKLRTHGLTKDPQEMQENHGGWYMELQELGYNYRMPDMLASLGISQLKKADAGLKRRKQIAEVYDRELKNADVLTPFYKEGHAFHLYVIQSSKRKELYDYLRTKNIFTQVHYIPVHLMPYYRQFGYKRGDFPNAESYYDRCLSLPMYPALTEDEQEYVIDCIMQFK